MIRFRWAIGIFLSVVFISTIVSVLLARQKGYFLSINSLRLRRFLGQVKQTPFRLFVNLLSRVRPGEVFVTRFQGVARGIAYGFVGVVVAAVCIIVFPGTTGKVVENNLTSDINTVWQVHATITGFSVVALVFVWETLEENVEASKLVGEMTEERGLLDRIYFLIIANLFIGAGLFMSSPLSPESTASETPALYQNLGLISVVLVSVFLVVSAWELLKYYEDILTLLFRKGPDQIAVNLYKKQLVDESGSNPAPTYREIIESKLGIELNPYMSLLPVTRQRDSIRVSAEEIDAVGKEITDINLSGISAVMEMIDEEADVSFWYNLGERPQETTSIMRTDSEMTKEERERLVKLLQGSYKFKS